MKCFFLILISSVLFFGCSGKGLSGGLGSGSNSGSGSGSGSGTGSGGGSGPFNIGGTVVGLVGTGMVLEDNAGDDLTIQANGPFTFKTAVPGAYAVTVKVQPSGPAQNCTVTNGAGTATTNITNIQVNCGSTGLTLGGSVAGLIGSGLTLQNNGANNFQIAGTGNVVFTFPTPITAGTAYAVTILTQPSNPGQTCFVANGTGTASGNVTNVQITCSQPSFTIGGSVVGLVEAPGDKLELIDNGGDDLFVTGDTTFTFPTQVTYGGIYNVNVFLPPTSQILPCNLFYYTGIALADVTSVVVDCQHNDWSFQSYYIKATESSNNYAAITTPLYPAGVLPPANIGTPGGRDFAAAWTDKLGRKWVFGGNGFPYPSPFGKQLPGLLNDLWVYDGTWVPANLPTFVDLAGNYEVNPGAMEQTDAAGVYGALNVASAGSTPGARWGSTTWTDSTGNLWMFGGQGINDTGFETLLNDVWEWIPGNPPSPNPAGNPANAGTFTGQWIWRGGSNTGNQNGVYGTKGVVSPSNIPGGRWAATTFVDSTGSNVWLFGGQGYDASGNVGILADLWEYNIPTGQWTWVAGPNIASPNGVYGTKGTPAPANSPGGRQAAVLWVDVSGNVWLFGGFGFDSAGTGAPQGASLNDLWECSSGQWTWVSGNNLANQTGTYGTQATSNLSTGAAANVPGSRWGGVGWTDASSNLWFFGGWGYGSVTTDPTGFLDDTWEYQHSTGQWIWWKGTNGVNQASQYIDGLGGGLPFVKYQAGARRGAALFQPDSFGYVWVFGGEGYDFTSGNPPGYLNDLWTYLPFP
jgi:hypothetical protein